ncbi:Putative Zn-dependent protease, contains TPR repeats [Andreprevotia lacus DSM 23236]|uniref:Putative Zn-dependent protease, contains TPR repeats n=1 Tax=Andreprevotia lacus DSM 23236 TaxID=1121001 RepID=A0A1W1WZG1_9NEIS|nr:M48 family metalloprotease [Andreprevotia lacus]SMC17035.1 Putative Zn-dependent protease, contains TPR repeats [Andreprevotia lacus DSM 23236]
MKTSLKRRLGVAMLCGLLAVPVHADVSSTRLPDLGDVSQEGLSPAQEREIGESAMKQLRRSGEMLDDPELQAYLNRIGNRLVDASGSGISFTFFPVNNREVNAFSIPGGYIGINTGLLVTAQHESELASVLGHEIAHVTQHHIARLIDGTRFTPWMVLAAIGVALLASRSGNTGNAVSAAITGSQALAMQKQLDFTYAFEQEADRIGMETLTAAGFDPSAMPAFFERLQKANRIYEVNAPEFLRTHPVTYKRIADAQARLKDAPYRQVADSADFLFMRERARVLQDKAQDMAVFYRKSLAEKRYTNLTAFRYGLALALLQAGDAAGAEKALKDAHAAFGLTRSNPVLEALEGQILLAAGRNGDAIAHYARAISAYPEYRVLRYGQVDALMAAGQLDQALKVAQENQQVYPADAVFYQREARIHAKAGRQQQQYRAQAEYYVRLNEFMPAIEQLQMAQRLPNGDFYTQSSIEARLRELQQQADPEGHERGGSRLGQGAFADSAAKNGPSQAGPGY